MLAQPQKTAIRRSLTAVLVMVSLAGTGRTQCSSPQGNALLTMGGLPYPGSSLSFAVAATPLLPVFLGMSPTRGSFTLPFGGTVCLPPNFTVMSGGLNPFQIVPPDGVWSMHVGIPPMSSLVGNTFYLQAAVFDSSAPNNKVALSNDLVLTIEPLPGYRTIFFDGFETVPSAGPWTASNGLWSRNVPTAGPQAPFAGQMVAATNPQGPNYQHSAVDTTWQGPILALPTLQGSERLLLRYRCWFGTEDRWDYMQPRILVDPLNPASTFQDLNVPAMSGSNPAYVQAGADLTAFAGQTVRLGYRFVSRFSGSCCGSGPGFFLDDVHLVVVGAPAPGLAENWDSPAGMGIEWYVDNGVWEVGTPPTSVPSGQTLPPQPFSGTGCAGTLLGLNYVHEGANTRLISPKFVVPSPQPPRVAPELLFMQWLDMEPGWDFGRVQYSTDGGSTWNDLGGSISARNGQWTQSSRLLVDSMGTPLTGQTIQVAFYFESRYSGSCCGAGAGWFLDDIVVQ